MTIVELHVIQNVVPSNLNRDDTGAPKDCIFGGFRRARVSSQALKRAARLAFGDVGLDSSEVGVRTRRVLVEVVRRLVERGRDESESTAVVEAALDEIGLRLDKHQNNEYLLFLGSAALDGFADQCDQHWDKILELTAHPNQKDGGQDPGGKGTKKKAKAGRQVEGLDPDQLFGAHRAVDIALFGRMVADLPERTVQAACQVAHAISTHEVHTEFDYFTAVDDLLPDAESGAGMIGTVEFNAACLYRYSCVDVHQLVENLDGDEDLAGRGLRAYLMATITTLPSGKQNSMAAHNPPSLVFIVRRDCGQWNLANAFADPVRPRAGHPLVEGSINRLFKYYDDLINAYPPSQAPQQAGCVLLGTEGVETPAAVTPYPTIDGLVEAVGGV